MDSYIYFAFFVTVLNVAAAANCSAPWSFSFGKSCYYFNRNNCLWSEARIACSSIGGHLAVIETAAEENFTGHYIHARHGGTWYWLGGTDFGREGTWYWDHTKKPIVYEDWHHGEPNGNRNENCLVKSGLEVDAWFSVDCLIAEVAYLCEKDNAL